MMAQKEQVKLTLIELENEFFALVKNSKATLTNKHLDDILDRFMMLPLSIKRQYLTDDNYLETRRRILASST
jgi:hypothetical protein